jgi:hypothetical protein
MAQAHKLSAMIFMAAGILLAQPPQPSTQPQNSPRLQEGAVCGQDPNGTPRILNRQASRDMNGGAQYQWACLSQSERMPQQNTRGGSTMWREALKNYNAQAPSEPSYAQGQGPGSPSFEQQYQQYQQMMPPDSHYGPPPMPVPNQGMPVLPQARGKVGRVFRMIQQAGDQAGQIRQLYNTR